ncbi:InlB B-repeat-containing protein [Candidatus Saccharibacteria bacterium]|nr:InlB B-repeat-containing protein [Candidatus Saccharibacteria bacterium]
MFIRRNHKNRENLETRKKHLKGDTLVEVMLAMAVFGAVIISTVSIMNHGLQSAEATLEDSMARNAIDVQAESLRFVAEVYTAEIRVDPTKYEYAAVWKYITDHAVAPAEFEAKYRYGSLTCTDYYDDSELNSESSKVKAGESFVLNPHKLDKTSAHDAISYFSTGADESKVKKIVIPSKDNDNFIPADTYPRLIFDSDLNANLIDEGTRESVSQVAGLWVTAVCDSTGVVGNRCNAYNVTNAPKYYDFYIRTCWTPPGSDFATTIGTTIRLKNPAITASTTGSGVVTPTVYNITYDFNGGRFETELETTFSDIASTLAGGSLNVRALSDLTYRAHLSLNYWTTNADGSGTRYYPGSSITPPDNMTLYAQWRDVTCADYRADPSLTLPDGLTCDEEDS